MTSFELGKVRVCATGLGSQLFEGHSVCQPEGFQLFGNFFHEKKLNIIKLN